MGGGTVTVVDIRGSYEETEKVRDKDKGDGHHEHGRLEDVQLPLNWESVVLLLAVAIGEIALNGEELDGSGLLEDFDGELKEKLVLESVHMYSCFQLSNTL